MMIGRGKSKQARSKRSSSGLKEDTMISQLPDPLICEILSHLPIKDAVQTSVLSTRWRSLWLWVPRLDLDSIEFRDFNDFVSFGNRFFHSNRVSCLHKLKLTLNGTEDNFDDDISYTTSWVDAIVKRKIQHLDVEGPGFAYIEMPLTFYICKTLIYLKLVEVSFDNADLSELSIAKFVSLPCLKTMHLEYISYPSEATFERLVSSCPVLEELTIVGCADDHYYAKVFRVLSRSLKKLSIELECFSHFASGVVIDAPQLRFLSINDRLSESFIIKNMHSKAKLDIWQLDFGLRRFDDANVVLPKKSLICDFLRAISRVKEMSISRVTFKMFRQYSKFEPVPHFRYMSYLDVKLYVPDLQWLPTFLESCPNLKSLILGWVGYSHKMHSEMNQISFSLVPQCLSLSLKSVDINSRISGYAAEMKIVRYFLESSAVLNKLTLRLNDCGNENVIFKKLLKIPRRSITCQVIVH